MLLYAWARLVEFFLISDKRPASGCAELPTAATAGSLQQGIREAIPVRPRADYVWSRGTKTPGFLPN